MATKGSLQPATMIRQEGSENWMPASKVKGLFASSTTPQPLPAANTIKSIEQQAEKISKKLWFLDLKFTEFFTPRLIGVVYVLFMLLTTGLTIWGCFYALWTLPVIKAAFAIVGLVIYLAISAVCFRVFLETFLVVFRIAEHLSYLKYLKKD